jgi:hypothetical protein
LAIASPPMKQKSPREDTVIHWRLKT